MEKRKINVLVITGGPSNEREISLKTGEQISKSLSKSKYSTSLIEITKEGKWLLRGGTKEKTKEKSMVIEKYEFAPFDVAFIGMHGKFGEDGTIQAFLEVVGIPYTGSGILSSALGMNKLKTLEFVCNSNIKVPNFIALRVLPSDKNLKSLKKEIKQKIGYPCVVKPNQSGSSIGISIVKNPKELSSALRKSFGEDSTVLIEQFISGIELTCAVMGNSGQTKLVALPPVEIIPAGKFFDYDSKYHSTTTKEICPARVNKRITKELQDKAIKIHELLGCDGLSRSDFILTKKNELYFLEINTIPGLTEASLSPKAAVAAGMSFSEFLDKQIQLALLKNKRR